jgi:CheY-like chemotaxis protein
VELICNIGDTIPPLVKGDPLRFRQVITNLLGNAPKFTEKGEICITLQVDAETDDRVFLHTLIRDTGIGIPADKLAIIFEPFQQADGSTTRKYGGTGLGLSICKQLAEHMEGTIDLESVLGEGSLFVLRIPVIVNAECELSKFDISMFEGMRFGLLRYDPSESYKLESLRRYWEYFGMEIEECDSLEEEVDLLIFLESSMDREKRQKIIGRQIPSVAILDFLDDRYDTVENIVPLTFPIYCTKLQGALNELMGHDSANPQIPAKTARRTGFSGKVLVAEDNDANQELVKIILERYGLEYTIVSNGQEAVERFCAEPFDIVLMDEQMPVMNGNDATAAILAYELQSGRMHTPIVAVTANVIKGTRERSIQNGYDAFLGKPIVLKEIEQVFERYLEPRALPEEIAAPLPKVHSGIDMEHLKSALLLNEDQISHLLGIYRQKMEKSLQELSDAIENKEYESIAAIGHSMKGSSANFRFEDLSRLARVIEESAAARDHEFDFSEAHEVFSREFRKRLG